MKVKKEYCSDRRMFNECEESRWKCGEDGVVETNDSRCFTDEEEV